MKRIAAAALLLAVAGAGLWWWLRPAPTPPDAPRPSVSGETREAPAALEGTVVDSSGEPVQGATVTATAGEQRAEVRTDDEGAFAFADLEGGTYRMDVRAEGFASPGPRPVREFEVQVPTEVDDRPKKVGITVRRPARLQGRVVAGDEPVEGARLSVYYAYAEGFRSGLDPFTLSNEATTGEDGRFELSQLAPGRLRLIAESDEHRARRSRELLVEPGDRREDIVIDLEPRGAVDGKVVGPEGEPVRARLRLSGGRLRSDRKVRADANGDYRIGRLPAGTYRMTARAEGYRVRTFDDLRVRHDEVTHRAVTLQKGEGLFGRVLDPEGEPVRGAFVRLERNGREQWRRTDESGQFQWSDYPGGTWSARAYSANHSTSSVERARPGRPVELEVGPGGYVRGTVVDNAGQPLSDVKLGVAGILVDGPQPYGRRAAGFQTLDSEDGTFRFGPLRPGKYELQADKSGYATATSSQFTVEAGETTRGIELVLGLGGDITGVVRSKASGDPISGARVSAFDMSSPFDSRKTKTDGEGRFTLEKVPAGRRSLRVRHDRHLTRVVSGLQVPDGGTVQKDVVVRRKKKGQKFGFRGIGASLQRTDQGVEIRRIIPGGGAEEKGLQRGDLIRSVDREPVDDLPLSRIVKKIRGREGEPVRLTIEREGRGKFPVEIERGRVVVGGGGKN